MRAVVVGGGTWGTGFARLLADRSFDVTLAVRDAAVAQQAGERRPPRASADHDDVHERFTKSIVTGVPSRSKWSRS